MRAEDVVRRLSEAKFTVFSLEELRAFYPKEKPETLKKYLFRWKKGGWIAGLRRGLYELSFPGDLNLPDLYLANKIYAPSYISLETVLSNYGLIPEVAMAVVSVTSKPTRRFKNKHGLFIYRTVQPRFFCGYRAEKISGYNVFIAEPEKALVDYLYFNTLRGVKLDLDARRMDRKRIKGLNSIKLKTYAEICGINLKETLYADL